MVALLRVWILGVVGALAALAIGGAQAADPNRLPDIGDAERVVVPGDGVELAAYLFRPEPPNGLRPAIVVLPAFGNSAWPVRGLGRLAAAEGYVALVPSLRGGVGSDLGTSLACDLKADDIVQAIDWLVQQPGIDPGRIGVWGDAMGGPVALLAASKTDSVKAVLVNAGPTDLSRYVDDNPYARNSIVYGCGSTGLDRNSPINFANDIEARVMLLHGGLNSRVPPNQSRLMFEALRRAGHDPELIILPNEPYVTGAKVWRDLWPRAVAHFEDAFRSSNADRQ